MPSNPKLRASAPPREIKLSTSAIHTVQPLEVSFPKGKLSVVTGVSGSGKTTLILESLVPGLAAQIGKRALVVAAWGRRRWNIETGFRVEKHGGFGLEHTFCNDDTAGRNYHVLMQIAYTLWQVFDTGVLSRLSEGCRKPSQEMWAKMLFVAILVLGLASVPRVAVGAMRMRRCHLVT